MTFRAIKMAAVVCVFLFATSSYAQPAKPSNTDATLRELTKITSEIYDAGLTGDRKIIEKYFAETFLETDAMGVLRDKKWNLENSLGSNLKVTYNINEAQVREYGNVAVLYYKWVLKYEVSDKGAERKEPTVSYPALQVTDTFIKTAQGWRLISSSRVRLRDALN